jgi:signal transduction histidine kinase
MKSSFSAKAQVQHIIDKFGHHAKSRGISIQNEINDDVRTPEIPIALYSGILLNLYTNALKAVIADSSSNKQRKICFKAWNEPKKHIIEILDDGIGIPPSLRKRIWDPLFTTTSNLNNPFGSGMGLGLSLIKKLLSDLGGSIVLINPPPKFTTCFKLELPLSK